MREYELTYIIQPEITDEGIQAIHQRLDGVLEKHGAIKLFYDDMGRRRLGYEIRKFQKGQYFTLFFLDEGKAVADLERALKLDDSILRFLTVLANPDVRDIDARRAEAAELERIRAEKAAERAAREAEEAERAAREAEEEAVREASASSAQAAEASGASDDDEAEATADDDEAEATADDDGDEEQES